MPTVLQFRRGTASQNNSFTGAAGEITVDTTNQTLRVHDNSTVGGAILVNTTATQTVYNKSFPYISGTTVIGGSGNLVANATTSSTSTTTGALVVTGGVGIGGAIYGGSTIIAGGNIVAASGTLSSSTTTGALVVTGGTGISGNVYIGGNVVSSSTTAWTVPVGTNAQRPGAAANGMIRYNSDITSFEGYYAGAWSSLGGVKSVDAKAYIIAERSAGAADDVIRVYAGDSGTSTQVMWASTSNISILPTTAATSSTTGALQIAGGVGIAGNVFTAGWIVPTANTSLNLGTTTSWWNVIYGNTFLGRSTSASYADLAENYAADSDYLPGTVLVFGGEQEVTVTTTSHDTCVAGVVSTNPAYLMNSEATGVPVALTGRVPCQVQGPVSKGTILVTSNVPGVAQAIDNSQFKPGCILGKALESINTNSIETIEVVVGVR
jgi:hypothetical protein